MMKTLGKRGDVVEIIEEFLSGFCRTHNGVRTVFCEYEEQPDGSLLLAELDCEHEKCVNKAACPIQKEAFEKERKK